MSVAVCAADDADADADAAVFPLNWPVLLTNPLASLRKDGDAGTLAATLDAITHQANPLTVVTRVAQGETAAETATNLSTDLKRRAAGDFEE